MDDRLAGQEAFNLGPGRPMNEDMSKVLVVEEEPSLLTVVRYHLESAGFEGVFAGEIGEGWRLMVSEAPDLAVVDVAEAEPDGWGLISRMRQDERFHATPVIALTPSSNGDVGARAVKMGCDYLSKPFAATALLAKIRHLVAASGAPQMDTVDRSRRDVLHVELVAIGVVLLMGAYRIQGKVYLPPELARFSDAWESVMRDQRAFVPVTDARIETADGGTIATPFIEVRKSDMQAVFPMDVAPN
jgi:CheY-like chemotaxis protein